MVASRKADAVKPNTDPSKGLFRTVLAGPGHTLKEAFAQLENAHRVERIARHTGRNLFGARITLVPDEGEGYWDFTRIRDEIFVVNGNFRYKDARVELLSGDDLLQFYFKLSGDLTMALTRAEPLHLRQPGLLIYRQPQGTEVSEWMAPSAHERCVTINIRPQALLDLFEREPDTLPLPLKTLIARSNGADIAYCQLPLSAEMFDLATKLIDNPHSGALALVYTEALVTQLMCVAVQSVQGLSGEPSEQYSQREVRCLYAARNLLMSRIARPPTIRQVARAAGMNETTLKRGFKTVFRETVFDFSVRCRMQHALMLLREQRMSVADVGEAVGYRHQTSFATAFRRHFGLRPKDVRRGRGP
jgi:AraC-like DNA-binding protein